MSKKNKNKEVKTLDVTVTNDQGEQATFDLNESSAVVQGLYSRALELKQQQVKIETKLVENHILINDYVAKIMLELNKKEEVKNEDTSKEK
tara:strand:+ start:7499 stop:7771 length:273 start_codon:yes stop_codon:yes gene_type:complete